ncbi:MAG: hypothetical protein JSW08_00295 [archaeon]|nr:MAG: hypothetical protein JSW08_00295 [archaeon]
MKKQRMKQTLKEGKRANKLLIAAVVAVVVVLLLGLLLGNQLATSRLEEFKDVEEMLLIQLISLEFREDLIEDVCALEWKDIWEQKAELGSMLTALERRLGRDSPKLTTKREIYELIEIKTIELLERIRTECHEDFSIILLFFTNKKNDPLGSAAGSADQGLILDQVYFKHNEQNYGRKVYIFVFDINSKNSASVALRNKYEIKEAPSLVIDGETYGYLVEDEIEELI